ncbi:uncharacterized protein CEXT_539401 [Caerostris extrusa]|uniref:Uncharacterized protein n=1 Tax=Caerostris extrusa TaxID=172846 RepID=A0AAV4NNN4_CAEEX|nr:uncharacterized protein CEXT_539401 [Caerostris extrusa]
MFSGYPGSLLSHIVCVFSEWDDRFSVPVPGFRNTAGLLSIQFDDRATSTFEYPSENASPSPREETDSWGDSSFNSTVAMGSASNSRLGLSNYTPQVLSSNNEFELGVSQSNLRPTSLPEKCQKVDDEILPIDAIIPANPDDTGGWSATETADILF